MRRYLISLFVIVIGGCELRGRFKFVDESAMLAAALKVGLKLFFVGRRRSRRN